jgi:hypothetical protein
MRVPKVIRFMDNHVEVVPVPGLDLGSDDYDAAYQFVLEASLRLAELDFDLDIPSVVRNYQGGQKSS